MTTSTHPHPIDDATIRRRLGLVIGLMCGVAVALIAIATGIGMAL